MDMWLFDTVALHSGARLLSFNELLHSFRKFTKLRLHLFLVCVPNPEQTLRYHYAIWLVRIHRWCAHLLSLWSSLINASTLRMGSLDVSALLKGDGICFRSLHLFVPFCSILPSNTLPDFVAINSCGLDSISLSLPTECALSCFVPRWCNIIEERPYVRPHCSLKCSFFTDLSSYM